MHIKIPINKDSTFSTSSSPQLLALIRSTNTRRLSPQHRTTKIEIEGETTMKEQPSSTSTNPLTPTTRTGRVTPCCSKVGLKRGPWTREEDELLCNYVRREGEGRWRAMPKKAGLLRCGKSCRLRWMNYLRPSVKRGNFAPDEEDLILRLHRLLGNRWSLIAGRIPGRTDNEIKNYWNTHLSKKLISQGIDPRTHKPLNPNNNNHPSNNNDLKIPSPNHQSLHLDETHMTKDMITTVNEQHDYDNNTVGDGVDCLSDDLFSSFLSSIINDDAFQKEVENNSNNINNHCSSSSNICKNGRKSDDNDDTATDGDVDFWKNVNLDESDHHQYMDFLDQIDEKLQY